MKKTNKKFCENIKEFVDGYSTLVKNAVTLSKEVHEKSLSLS